MARVGGGVLLGRQRGGPISGAAGGPAFSPSSLSPAVWYDFSTLAGADGSAIASINDLSGNARTASQATGTSQPLVKAAANGINNLKVGLFDGVDDVLKTASFAIAQPMTVYAVVTGGGSGPLRYFAGLVAEAVRLGYGVSPDSPNNFAGSVLTAAAGVAANPKVITSVINGVSSLIRIDGSQVVAGDVGAGVIGAGISLGASDVEQFWNGKIGELFVVPGSSVSTAAEAYLKSKWGTP